MTYCFGKFSLDKKSRKLLFDGVQVAVNQRGIDILIHLIEQNGATASKEDILASVWPDQVVQPSNLVKQISLLRRALGELSPDSDIILTIPGIGYRVEQWAVAPPTISTNESELSAETDREAPAIIPPTPPVDPPKTFSRSIRSRFRSLTRLQMIITVLVLLIVLVVVFLLAMVQLELKRVKSGPSKVLLARTKAKTNIGFKRNLNYSPDGKSIAYYQSEEPEGPGDIFILKVVGDESIRLPFGENSDDQVAWSPTGERLALLRSFGESASKRQLVITSPEGQSAETIAEVATGGLDWAPDGRSLAVCDRPGNQNGLADQICPTCTRISIITIDGKSRRDLTVQSADSITSDHLPRFSPDGSMVAFIRQSANSTGEIFIVGVYGGEPHQLTFDKREISDLDWSDDGREILFISNRSGNQRLWRISAARTASPPLPSLMAMINGEVRNFTISGAGNFAYISPPARNTEINLVPLPGKIIDTIIPTINDRKKVPCSINNTGYTHSPRFSPDGRRVTFISNSSGSDQIWISNSDCSNQRQISLLNQKEVGHPDWSPDGTRIAFDQIVDGQSDIFDIEVDGGSIRRLTNSPANETLPKWSRNGQEIYFCLWSDNKIDQKCQIWKMPLNGGEALAMANNNEGEYAAPASGSYIYFTRNARIWRKNTRLEGEEPLPQLREFPVGNNWNLVADSILLISTKRGEEHTLRRFDLNTGLIERIMNFDGVLSRAVPGLDVSPDGKIVAFNSITSPGQDIRLIKSFR